MAREPGGIARRERIDGSSAKLPAGSLGGRSLTCARATVAALRTPPVTVAGWIP